MKKVFITSLLVSALGLGFTGCLKDKGFEDHEYGINDPDDSPVGIGIPEAQNDINNRSIDASASPQTLEDAHVVLFGGEAAKEDIHVKLVLNNQIITDYNTANGTNLVVLPTTSYNIPSLEVVIPKGQKMGNIVINFPNASTMDPTKLYALGFTVQGVTESGYTIAENYKNLLLTVAIKNKYDGVYTVTGVYKDIPNAGFTATYPHTNRHLITSGPNSVTLYSFINGALTPGYLFSNAGAGTYYGNWAPIFTFDPATNKLISVTNYYGQGTNSSGRSGAIDPTGDAEGKNRFFPADHSIKAKYIMIQNGANRATFDETYTYTGPR